MRAGAISCITWDSNYEKFAVGMSNSSCSNNNAPTIERGTNLLLCDHSGIEVSPGRKVGVECTGVHASNCKTFPRNFS